MNLETTLKFYKDVVENVINDVREAFLEDNVPEDVLRLLKSTWERKLSATKPEITEPQTASSLSLKNDVPLKIVIPQSSQEIMIKVPRYALGSNKLLGVLNKELLSTVANLPQDLATSMLQQKINAALGNGDEQNAIVQVDGSYNSSSDEESSLSEEDEVHETNDAVTPINSDDDITGEDSDEGLDTENIILCQYNQVVRRVNRWKFSFKSGIMNLKGKDYVFDCAMGTAEW